MLALTDKEDEVRLPHYFCILGVFCGVCGGAVLYVLAAAYPLEMHIVHFIKPDQPPSCPA
jgi:hypothetical protein